MNTGESNLSVLFDRVATAIEHGHYRSAIKLADSARRYAPQNSTAILLHSRLMLEMGAAREALDALRERDDAESLMLQTEAACKAGLPREAGRFGQSLLARFAADSVEGLPRAAARLCGHYGHVFPGWVGVDSSLRLVGELPAGSVARIHHDGTCVGEIESPAARHLPTAFSEVLPRGRTGPLRISVGERELLGSGLHWPPDFRLSGWVVVEDQVLAGEACLDWAPQSSLRLLVAHAGGEYECTVTPTTRGAVGWSFSSPLQGLRPDQSTVEVAVLLPDGSRAPLTGSPILLRSTPRLPIAAMPDRRESGAHARTTVPAPGIHVVVPVYAGRDETLRCLRSVLASTPSTLATVTVVDDASPDPELRAALDAMADDGRITVLRNAENLGFPGAANRGIRLHADRDVVLLNSDTEVFDGWLQRLRAAAYSADDIGTVTPLGEAAAITSYPRSRQHPCSAADAAEIDAIAREVNAGKVIDIPVGVGFCLFVRRRCLDDVGELDAHGFGKGYGEENDFCLRARRHGWRHVAAAGLFIRHVGGRSFGAAKEVLTTRNARVIQYRHPGYEQLIADFVGADPLRNPRRAIDRQRLLNAARAPVLLITLDLPGGVRRHVEFRQALLRSGEHTAIVLHAAAAANGVPCVTLRAHGMDFEDLRFDLPDEQDELAALLRELRLVRMELHHFLGLPGTVLQMLVRLGVPYQVFIHDYAWICPRVTLLGGSGRYCGEPEIGACEDCVAQHGSALREALTVKELRERSARLLAGAERVVAPTQDVRNRLSRYFPGLPIEVTPWQEAVRPQRSRRARRAGPIRVAMLGAIGLTKGYAVLLDCARDAAARNLPLEFVVIGYTRDDAALLDTGRVFITGPYAEEEAPALIERERCDILFFPSLGPETWCYTLTYALAQDLCIVGFDMGAVGERLRAAGTGVLLPVEMPATLVNDVMIRRAAEAAAEIAAPLGASGNEGRCMQTSSASDVGSDSSEITATVQLMTLPVGVYAFTVTSGGAPRTNGLALPALQVTPAPMSSEGTIELLGGPATVDRWLTRSGDVVVAKISQGSVTLLLTSLRSSASGVLSIDVRRIDAPDGAESPAPGGGELPASPASSDQPLDHLRPKILVHVQNVGDLEFSEGWAGLVADNFWIEAFSASLSEPPFPDLLEYKGVNLMDHESAWLSGGEFCGSRGTGIPLVAFAVRVNEAAGIGYSCKYSGRFLSGSVVGPVSDGELCRSVAPGDPLVALELAIEKRPPDDASVRA